MKKLAYIASALLLSALLTGCADNEGTNISEDTTSICLTAGFETADGTRTANPTAPVWTDGDEIGINIVYRSTGNVVFKNVGVAGVTDDGGQTATFVGTLPGFNAGEYSLHGYYPYGTEGDNSATATEVKIEIPAVQKPLAGTFDPMADVMLMRSFDYSHKGGAMSQDGLQFKRALGMIKFVLNSPELDGQPIKKLTFRTDNPDLKLAGKATFDLTVGEFAGFYSDAVTEVTAEPVDDILAYGTDEIWICIPAMTIGTDVTITIEGETESYAFTKSATVGEINGGQPIEIVAGDYHTMNVTLRAYEVDFIRERLVSTWFEGDFRDGYGPGTRYLTFRVANYNPIRMTSWPTNAFQIKLGIYIREWSSDRPYTPPESIPDFINGTYVVESDMSYTDRDAPYWELSDTPFIIFSDYSVFYHDMTYNGGGWSWDEFITGGSMTIEGDQTNYHMELDLTGGGRGGTEYHFVFDGPMYTPNDIYLQ